MLGGRSWDDWIARYAQSHQHPVNRVLSHARDPADRRLVAAVPRCRAHARLLADTARTVHRGLDLPVRRARIRRQAAGVLPRLAVPVRRPAMVGRQGPRPGLITQTHTHSLMRVAIVGNSGSGKSTLAGQIAAAHSIASLDLDTVAWEPGKIAVARAPEAAAADVTAFCSTHDRWVVEGCYAALVGHAVAYSPLLLFIDPGMDACLAHCRNRPWEPHKYASKAEQDAKLEFLLTWVRGYYSRDDDLSLSAHRTLFESYHGLKLRLAHHQTTWLDDLAGRFQGCAVPAKEWTHAAHLVVGLWHVHRYGAMDALVRLRTGIRRLNESHGGVNSTTNGYHETITAAYCTITYPVSRPSRD